MNKRTILTLAALAGVAIGLRAQTPEEGFFLRDNKLSFQYNPAMVPEGGFLSVGKLESATLNNVGMGAFLYPAGDRLVTGLNEAVPAGTFLGNLLDDNRMLGDLKFNLFSWGVRKGDAFHTAEVSIRGNYGASVPKEIFTFMKLGSGEGSFDMADFRLQGQIMVEAAYGYTRRISDILSVGARAKLLLGMYGGSYNVTRFNLSTTDGAYTADCEAQLELTSRKGMFLPNENGYIDFSKLSFKDMWKLPSAGGLAVDLGVVLTPAEGLTLSASVLDLGALVWYYGNAGYSEGVAKFEGLGEMTRSDLNAAEVVRRLLGMGDKLIQPFRPMVARKKVRVNMIPFRAHLGAKYEMPFYRALSIGATGSYIAYPGLAWWDARLGVEVNPVKWFDVMADAGMGAFGPVWGMAVSVKMGPFCLTTSLQDGFGKKVPYTRSPLKANNRTVTIGLTYDLGR